MKLTLPTDSNERKNIPLYSGCYTYFPAALAGVAMHSKTNNEKHNPGEPLHHSRGKSSDHADCIVRHAMDIADMLALLERGGYADGLFTELNSLCWRALAWSQELHERFNGAPLAPAARLPEVNPPCEQAPAVERSDCPAVEPTQTQYGQIPALSRASLPDLAPVRKGDPQQPFGGHRRV